MYIYIYIQIYIYIRVNRSFPTQAPDPMWAIRSVKKKIPNLDSVWPIL